ncbi:cytochrome c oxidase accessory protein CcoG [Pseudobacteriovorax antillogorgiicola]|uniref:Cytochrome c oxidase accessory protein FixG n=1 Tax=Pseudobacteriovorax antillogorgiicola TaxID=1513793 RepID=A0A1Y6BJ75_9BACT|nr:cytochrome c oxidase accessory protein CcoG [Pseudobacteriovorax antillogorgiicola]TCS56412.1 cytochrome c oxidase accessory protein FixG [Pseudobacteriovorax antillogorgiicola]SMF05827.1 cytochrome c oxidase accessory protein FixG [Pseudobacteriovorax antillogorgiicola]
MKDHEVINNDRLRAPTVDASGRRRWIYPERRQGRLIKIRRALAMVLMAIYIIAPFSTFQGRPLIRLDVLESKAYFVGLVFPFHDASYLVFILIGLALMLFLVTALYGRLWCGYACPQTVFVEWLIRPIEEFFEGPASRRMVRDKGPWSLEKTLRKTGKHITYIIVVAVISNAFLAFFVDYKILLHWIVSPPSENPWAFSFMVFLSAMLYFDLTWFREQFCSFICPYARFQAVMIDRHTPTISYDHKRGEPRSRRPGKGDCIDCKLCVRVCPTGIDIRDGLQMECIQCGRCADACDQIQTNLKRPIGLIRTASEAELEGTPGASWRMRPILYGLGLVITMSVIAIRLNLRDGLRYTVIRQPGTTYSEMEGSLWGNFFTIRIDNQTNASLPIKVKAPEGVTLICNVCQATIKPFSEQKGLLVVQVPQTFRADAVTLSFGDGETVKLPLIIPGNEKQ